MDIETPHDEHGKSPEEPPMNFLPTGTVPDFSRDPLAIHGSLLRESRSAHPVAPWREAVVRALDSIQSDVLPTASEWVDACDDLARRFAAILESHEPSDATDRDDGTEDQDWIA